MNTIYSKADASIVEASASKRMPDVLQLTAAEQRQLYQLATEIASRYAHAEDPAFIHQARILANDLPPRVLSFLHDFKYEENNYGACLIKGYPINQASIGPTPASIDNHTYSLNAFREEILLVLFNSVLGDLMSWSTQREGRLINDIFPIKGHEKEQLSTASESNLEWHIEEAFHPFRADSLSLFCVRNYQGIATTFASITNISIPDDIKRELFMPKYIFQTDNNFKSSEFRFQDPVPVLFGDYNSPYLRIDPAFMNAIPHAPEAEKALATIIQLINDQLEEVVLEAGDYSFIDNYRVVHGRKPFVPLYDGQDRWLKRALVTRDLRKSRTIRKEAASRVLITG